MYKNDVRALVARTLTGNAADAMTTPFLGIELRG